MGFLKLERPIVFFDLETTGTDVVVDRIVQIAAIKLFPSGDDSIFKTLVNPGCPIPEAVTQVHGITDDDVKDAPSFKDIAHKLGQFVFQCDFGGYNIAQFDLPMLYHEFFRVGHKLDLDVSVVDAFQIFRQREERTLEAAVAFYTGGTHDNAHDALEDVLATIDVLEGQLGHYGDIPNTPVGISEQFRDADSVDMAGKLKWHDDTVVFTFGKHSGRSVMSVDRGYLSWCLRNNVIGPDAEHIIQDALAGKSPSR